MPYYRSVGDVPRKRHTQFRQPDGTLYAEELVGQEGFSSDSSLLYHRHAPTAILAAEEFAPPTVTRVPNLPLKPRHLRTHKLDGTGADPVLGRQYLLANDDVRIAYVLADRPSPLFRDATGDHCLYLEAGSMRVESPFGVLDAVAGDYVVIPTSTIHRLVPTGDEPTRLLAVEASGHIGPPKRYLSVRGQFLEHAPYCERDVRGPDTPLLVDGEEVEVLVKHRRGWTRYVYANHPFDVVGWDGHMYPWAFSIHDFEPITGRIHQPPPVHQTFQGPNFVICSFVPRKVDYHPAAIPVPYNHHNVDSDEMLFYTGGNYEARRGSGIEQGSISLHPSGFTHGPQPGAAERSIGAEFFDELAVMVDTFRPLDLCDAAADCEDDGYAWTWARKP
ncbi:MULTISPECIES: homogentisate 1,2-dioxygenase [Micromonospora]|uniref:Homogentisate 1,2-dioxygenase n=1 Tax=Micromonospora chalcea TaxID=1874 RepID=A0ABX9XW31_MICCH|nr:MULTISPECIES: homogentisate 1,2-dioxygenase domain-containing protein [Micromonospora]EWM67147.1 homogentisate 1,2-dioxygenase [Micromonospora sp. M42]MBC8992168.1 homogentisate 1,2-dioxygenase [Micromonospora chalcea]MBP1786015.1 homogentisate 1,2-dioxygenase [Micromonospora sp. HB375]MCK1805751.1 homogentisate 1,2-dioxygenase [Micromonospora sp. R42106]MCK1830437.1 homogentisate 1,2-dioxygenase [Micromonospora sp. R42003]